jgi:chorismate mutase/prephenate dehydratase
VYFLDIDGHADDAKVKAALAGLRQEADLFRILGAYPRAVL